MEAQEINAVENFDLEKYSGLWHEIARYPHGFEKNCEKVTAEYTLNKRFVTVKNVCVRNEKRSSVKGKAFSQEENTGKLKVQFFWPFRSNYWVILLADDYRYAVVSEPGKRYLWILAREKSLSPEDLSTIQKYLDEKGFQLDKLIYVKQ